VFYDPRNDCYPPQVLRQGWKLDLVQSGWQQVIDNWKIDTVITPSRKLSGLLRRRGWQVRGKFGGDAYTPPLVLLRAPAPPGQMKQRGGG
jgi:hypothetical protein